MTILIAAVVAGLALGLTQGLIGAGGAILAVPVLVYAFGQSPQDATTLALAVVAASSLAGVLGRRGNAEADRGRMLRTGLVLGLASVPGVLGGTALNRVASADLLLAGYALLLLIAAVTLLRRRPGSGGVVGPRDRRALWRRVAPLGLVIGVLGGLFGVGGGFLLVPGLAVLLAQPTSAAIATALVAQIVTSLVALAAHLGSGGGVDPLLAVLLATSAGAGAIGGARLGGRLGDRGLERAFALVVAGVATAMLAGTVPAILGPGQ